MFAFPQAIPFCHFPAPIFRLQVTPLVSQGPLYYLKMSSKQLVVGDQIQSASFEPAYAFGRITFATVTCLAMRNALGATPA